MQARKMYSIVTAATAYNYYSIRKVLNELASTIKKAHLIKQDNFCVQFMNSLRLHSRSIKKSRHRLKRTHSISYEGTDKELNFEKKDNSFKKVGKLHFVGDGRKREMRCCYYKMFQEHESHFHNTRS